MGKYMGVATRRWGPAPCACPQRSQLIWYKRLNGPQKVWVSPYPEWVARLWSEPRAPHNECASVEGPGGHRHSLSPKLGNNQDPTMSFRQDNGMR